MGRYDKGDGEGCFLLIFDIILCLVAIAFLLGAGLVWLLTAIF